MRKKEGRGSREVEDAERTQDGCSECVVLRLANVEGLKQRHISQIDSSTISDVRTGTKHRFSMVLGPQQESSHQVEIYQLVKPLLAGLFSGRSTSVFSLGADFAGKSFAIQGTRDHPGLLPRTVEFLFNHVQKYSRLDADNLLSIASAVP
jgi:hypothetical protein